MLGVAASLAVNALIAGAVGSWTWLVVVLAGLLAFGSGLLEALGPGVVLIAILGTIEFLISSSQPVGTTTALIHAALVGPAASSRPWWWPGPGRITDLERQALAAAYDNLSAYALALPEGRLALADAQVIEDLRATLAAWAGPVGPGAGAAEPGRRSRANPTVPGGVGGRSRPPCGLAGPGDGFAAGGPTQPTAGVAPDGRLTRLSIRSIRSPARRGRSSGPSPPPSGTTARRHQGPSPTRSSTRRRRRSRSWQGRTVVREFHRSRPWRRVTM